MVSSKASNSRRHQRSRSKILLDQRRLKAIKRRIADGYYNRSEVSRSIAERLVGHLVEENEDDEE